MPDLLVDTVAQRMAAQDLREAAQVAGPAASSGGRLRAFVPAVGGHRACSSLGHFLSEWTYGMGLIAHQVETLASYLDTAASAYESIEVDLARAAGGGGSVGGFSVPAAEPLPEPPAKRSAASWVDGSVFGVPVTMANASRWRQLMPGEPEDVRRLAGMLGDFELDACRAAGGLRRLSGSGWQGQAAQAFAGHIEECPARLDLAARAFGTAGGALQRYAGELAAAQRGAANAWQLWHDAAAQTASAAGAAAVVPGSGLTPEEDQARALVLLRTAREENEAAARMLAASLDEAAAGAPNEPGLLARMTRAVVSFATGAGEGVVGVVEGVVALGALAYKLQPSYALMHPHDYLKPCRGC